MSQEIRFPTLPRLQFIAPFIPPWIKCYVRIVILRFSFNYCRFSIDCSYQLWFGVFRAIAMFHGKSNHLPTWLKIDICWCRRTQSGTSLWLAQRSQTCPVLRSVRSSVRWELRFLALSGLTRTWSVCRTTLAVPPGLGRLRKTLIRSATLIHINYLIWFVGNWAWILY